MSTNETSINNMNAEQEDDNSSGWPTIRMISNWLKEHVNIQQVRKTIAQNQLEIIILIVILIYLIYYFSQVSKKPKLIGNSRSKFVQYIRSHLKETLNQRFSPLIYFWGTNPQTALFGYLQGQTSLDEMPRSKFKRQFLYVSDAQYLTTNVDLSKYHHHSHDHHNQRTKSTDTDPRDTTSQPTAEVKMENDNCSGSSSSVDTSSSSRSHLQVARLRANAPIFASYAPLHHNADHTPKEPMSLLERNIHLALEHMMRSGQGKQRAGRLHMADDEMKLAAAVAASSTAQPVGSQPELSSSSSASGSSSDSGVFPSGNSSACWSASSRASSCSLESDDEPAGSELSQSCNNSHQHHSQHHHHGQHQNQNHCTGRQHHQQKLPFCCKTRHDPEPILFANSPLVGGQLSQSSEPATKESQEFGQCALDWHKGSHQHYHKNRLVALLAGGMTTGSDRKYVTDTVTTLDKLGYEVCVFIRRGVGGLRLSSAKFFSPAKWRDFEAAVLSVRQQRPGARLVAIGFSFGSLELCRYLAMSANQSLIHAALLVSCPFDPEAGGRNMRKRALNKRIDKYLARNLGKQLHEAMFASSERMSSSQKPQTIIRNLNGSLVDLSHLPKIKSLVDFEDNYNRPLQNYPDSESYAIDSRLHEHLKFIRTPTLCLSSEDDFMAPVKLLPLKEIESNKNLCMILTKRGGHMGFVNGVLWPKKPYFAQSIIGQYMGSIRNSLLFEIDSKNDLDKESLLQQVPLLSMNCPPQQAQSTASANIQIALKGTKSLKTQAFSFQQETRDPSVHLEQDHPIDDHYQTPGSKDLNDLAANSQQQVKIDI